MAGYVQDAIMLLGDSLTEMSTAPYGLAQLLTDAYRRKLDVVVRGFSGYNSTWILPVFEQVLAKQSERANLATLQLLTIWLGANDATFPGEAQHVPLETFKANMRRLVRMVTDPHSAWHSPATRVVLLTPPPVYADKWRDFLRVNGTPPRDTSDRDLEGSRVYAEATREVALQEGVALVDTWTLLWDAAGGKEENLTQFLSDGLHLSTDGYKLVYDALVKLILERYPEIHFDKPFMAFPPWNEVNNDNYMELWKESTVRKGKL